MISIKRSIDFHCNHRKNRFQARGLHWRIEGRGRWLDVPGEALEAVALGNPERTSKAIEAIGSGLRSEPPSDGRLMEYGSGDVGVPGEKYRIRLRVAGRYRAPAARSQLRRRCRKGLEAWRTAAEWVGGRPTPMDGPRIY